MTSKKQTTKRSPRSKRPGPQLINFSGRALLESGALGHNVSTDSSSVTFGAVVDVDASQARLMMHPDPYDETDGSSLDVFRSFFWNEGALRWFGVNSLHVDKKFDTGCQLTIGKLPPAEVRMHSIHLTPSSAPGVFSVKLKFTIRHPGQKVLFAISEGLKSEVEIVFAQTQLQVERDPAPASQRPLIE